MLSRHRAAGRARRRSVLIEALEGRTLLATYTGTAGNDDYLVRVKSGGGFVEILLNNSVIDTQAIPVSPLTFNMGAGNDTLTIAASVSASITMNGQGGSDTLALSSSAATVTFQSNTSATAPEDAINNSAGSTLLSGVNDLNGITLSGSATLAAASSGGNTLYTSALSLSGSAKLDLNNNDLVVRGGSFASIQSWVTAGHAPGGSGIVSSTAFAAGGNLVHAVIDNALAPVGQWPLNNGHTIPAASIIAHYTIFGDVNFDHQVSGDDYTVVDSNLNTTPAVGRAWVQGDANVDGNVTGDDYTTIDSKLNLRNSTPPDVAMSAPAANATLSGSVSLSATALDNSGLASVQFLLDGQPIGAPDIDYPFSTSWNTALAANGTHKLSARATDSAGNVSTSSLRTVKTSNTVTDPAIVGQWSSVISLPIVPINMTLLPNSKVLMWEGEEDGGSSARVWDYNTNTFTLTPNSYSNIFCSGHASLSDGRIVVMGGFPVNTQGSATSEIFNPTTNTWTAAANMAYRRWYGSATTLPDGRVIAVSGSQQNLVDYVSIPEVYNVQTNTWTQLTGASRIIHNYPHPFVLPDGRLLIAGSSENPEPTYALNVASQTWDAIDTNTVNGGSSVMYLPGLIMKTGSAATSDTPGNSAPTTYTLDMTTGGATSWQQTDSMAFARAHHHLTILPDGNVMVTGGGTLLDGTTLSAAVKTPEMWNPTTQAWTQMAAHQRPRLYHSTALLLPDGRVLIAGGGRDFGLEQGNELNAEIYSPPYLFKGARPTITSAPDLLPFGNPFTVTTPDAASIQSVSLVRLGMSTHNFNFEQRRVPLTFTNNGAGGLTVTGPANANLAPPGYYMLFIVNGNGVPSVARIVRMPGPSEDVQPPTTPTNVSATGSAGKADITWTGSTDNIGIDDYGVYRGTTSGFTPGVGNLIGRSPTTSYTDLTSGAGTFFYKIIARDVAGNFSAESLPAQAIVTADTTPPAVSITAPTENANVSGLVALTASASDNAAVAGVQFYVDSVATGAEDTAAPYSINWNSSGVNNGPHTVYAIARDHAGNTATATTVHINVANTAPPNLIAAWNFNEDSGYTAFDSSGNNLLGTLNGPAYVPGKYGSGLLFDGVNDYVIVPDNNLLDFTTAMTLEAWVYPTQNGNWRTIMLKERGTNGLSYALYGSDDLTRPNAWIHTSSGDFAANGSSAIGSNTWTHLAATYDGTNLKLYVNGVLAATTNIGGAIVTSTNALRIGGNSIWGEWFNGILDEVRVYNRPLSASEIQFDMATPI